MTKRRVLILGGGGREHALAWGLTRSPSVGEVVVAPGNAGCAQPKIRDLASIRRLEEASLEPAAVVATAKELKADLVVVGPEGPLCAGVVDALEAAGVPAFGPSQQAARLEGSKAFMKRFAKRYGIPTAPFVVTSDYGEAARWIDERGRPVVVKADGLAGGKGAIVTDGAEEAKRAARRMLLEGSFGEAGRTVVVEDRLEGYELSVHVITDGERTLMLPVARDHKRLSDGGKGPNTGGMGAVAPIDVDSKLLGKVTKTVIEPTLAGMREEGCPFRGVLYAGLMVVDGKPLLLEHNVRFGDPETQALVALLDGDLADLFASVAAGRLDAGSVTIAPRASVAIVLASEGYPGSPRKGDLISGIDQAAVVPGVTVLHAGTGRQGGALVSDGGRVLTVVATGADLAEARDRAYRAAPKIHWPGVHFRRDVGA